MRTAINQAVAISQVEYIMRTDKHRIFGKSFDVILIHDCQ